MASKQDSKPDSPADESPVAGDQAPEAQPKEFSIDFPEWKSGKPAAYAIYIAGFEHRLKVKGGLMRKQKPEAWEKDFQAFLGGEVGKDGGIK